MALTPSVVRRDLARIYTFVNNGESPPKSFEPSPRAVAGMLRRKELPLWISQMQVVLTLVDTSMDATDVRGMVYEGEDFAPLREVLEQMAEAAGESPPDHPPIHVPNPEDAPTDNPEDEAEDKEGFFDGLAEEVWKAAETLVDNPYVKVHITGDGFDVLDVELHDMFKLAGDPRAHRELRYTSPTASWLEGITHNTNSESWLGNTDMSHFPFHPLLIASVMLEWAAYRDLEDANPAEVLRGALVLIDTILKSEEIQNPFELHRMGLRFHSQDVDHATSHHLSLPQTMDDVGIPGITELWLRAVSRRYGHYGHNDHNEVFQALLPVTIQYLNAAVLLQQVGTTHHALGARTMPHRMVYGPTTHAMRRLFDQIGRVVRDQNEASGVHNVDIRTYFQSMVGKVSLTPDGKTTDSALEMLKLVVPTVVKHLPDGFRRGPFVTSLVLVAVTMNIAISEAMEVVTGQVVWDKSISTGNQHLPRLQDTWLDHSTRFVSILDHSHLDDVENLTPMQEVAQAHKTHGGFCILSKELRHVLISHTQMMSGVYANDVYESLGPSPQHGDLVVVGCRDNHQTDLYVMPVAVPRDATGHPEAWWGPRLPHSSLAETLSNGVAILTGMKPDRSYPPVRRRKTSPPVETEYLVRSRFGSKLEPLDPDMEIEQGPVLIYRRRLPLRDHHPVLVPGSTILHQGMLNQDKKLTTLCEVVLSRSRWVLPWLYQTRQDSVHVLEPGMAVYYIPELWVTWAESIHHEGIATMVAEVVYPNTDTLWDNTLLKSMGVPDDLLTLTADGSKAGAFLILLSV